jgi:hypothetical protein
MSDRASALNHLIATLNEWADSRSELLPATVCDAIRELAVQINADFAPMQAVIKAAREFVEANRAVMSRDTKGFDAFSAACDRVMAAQKALRDALAALDSQGGGC